MSKKPNRYHHERVIERIHRAAYDWEALANRMRYDNYDDGVCNTVLSISSQMGKLARSMADRLDRSNDR